jgi:hypothetical protein
VVGVGGGVVVQLDCAREELADRFGHQHRVAEVPADVPTALDQSVLLEARELQLVHPLVKVIQLALREPRGRRFPPWLCFLFLG